MNQLLDASGVSFSWGENDVLKELNLQIKENELVSILGVNGAGKSTLLNPISKVIPSNIIISGFSSIIASISTWVVCPGKSANTFLPPAYSIISVHCDVPVKTTGSRVSDAWCSMTI